MAAIKFFLGFFCLIAINNAGRTFSNFISPEPKDPYNSVVVAAQKEVGVREGSIPNAGKRVSEYLGYVGINTPDKWCAAWVSYVFGQAGYSVPKTAWSPALFPGSKLVKNAKPGIVLGIYYPSLKRIAHCGIVEGVKNDWIFSIEGNTNVNGSREGDGVYRRKRHIRSIHRFADWIK
jgi:hypothetical protein